MNTVTNPDQIIFSNRKSLSLIIKPNGEFLVRSPKRYSKEKIYEFIHKKQEWINKHLAKILNSKVERKYFNFEAGSTFIFRGEDIRVEYNLNQSKALIYNPIERILILNPDIKPAKKVGYDWLFKQAKLHFDENLKYWSEVMKLYPKNTRISNAKTRWGSCTGKNTISLNWRLILVPSEILNYVIIHELAHIKQKNHSAFFWDLVNKFDIKFKEHRKWLKSNGNRLISSFDPKQNQL